MFIQQVKGFFIYFLFILWGSGVCACVAGTELKAFHGRQMLYQ